MAMAIGDITKTVQRYVRDKCHTFEQAPKI